MDLDEAARLRKEKMSQLKRTMENEGFRDDLTSAPSIVHVDEFHEELSMAERKKREAERMRLNAAAPNKQRFFMELNKKNPGQNERGESDFQNNALIAESSRRSQDLLANKKLDQDIESIFADDPDLYEVSTISGRVANHPNNEQENSHNKNLVREAEQRRERFQSRPWHSQDHDHDVTLVGEHGNGDSPSRGTLLDQNRSGNNVQNGIKDRGKDRPGSHQTKIYDDGQFVDAGYDSISTNASSMPTYHHNSNNNNNNNNNQKSDNKRFPREDPLSQSLQDWKLRKMVQPSEEESKVTCVYDSRMFSNDPQQQGSPPHGKFFDSETEADYFSKMSARNNTKRNVVQNVGGAKNSFREFLSNSFSRGGATNHNPKISNVPLNESHASAATISGVHLEEPWMSKTKSHFNNNSNNNKNSNNRTQGPIDENDETVDCIDLKNEDKRMRRSRSPDTFSVQTSNTEFGDPDRNGRAKKLRHQMIGDDSRRKSVAQRSRDFFSTSFPGMMLFIHGFSGRSGEQQLSTNHVQSMTSSNPDRSAKLNTDYDDDNESCCNHCGNEKKRKRRGISCGTLLFLLAIDAFTIALLLILFYNIKSYSGPPPYPYAREGRDNPYFDKQVSNGQNFDEGKNVDKQIANGQNFDAGVDGSKTRTTLNNNGDGGSNPGLPNNDVSIRVVQPQVVLPPIGIGRDSAARGLDEGTSEPDWNIADINQVLVNLTNEIQNLKKELDSVNHPPAFACHRTDPFVQEGIITFTSCNILTEGMNPGSGIFTVRVPGIYQLSFTGLFHILNGHQIDADIIRQTPDGSFSNLGRSSADTNEIATFFVQGTDDDLMITATMMTMVRLNFDDKIYVETRLSEGHGKSTLKSSSSDPSIHFVGQRIGS